MPEFETKKPNRRRGVILAGLGLSLLALTALSIKTQQLTRRAESDYPPQGRYVDANGIRTHAIESGTGQPVVLIHGDGGSVYDFAFSIFDRLRKEYRTIAIDRPGLGYSERPTRDHDPFVQAEILHAACEALGAERPILVGHSRGGTIALAYALRYPQEIHGVVNLAGQAYPEGEPAGLPFQILDLPLVGPIAARTLFPPMGRSGVRAGLMTAFKPEGDPPPAYLDAYASLDLRPSQLMAHAGDMVHADNFLETMTPSYAKLSVPVAIVHGTEDLNVDLAQSRRLEQELSHARLFAIEGAGHEIMFWHPDVVMDAITWILERSPEHPVTFEMTKDQAITVHVERGM